MMLRAIAADPRGLAAFRTLYSLQCALELATFWVWEVRGPEGLLSEQLLPRHEMQNCVGAYCATTSTHAKTVLALVHFVALLALAAKLTMPRALLVYAMQTSLHNRNLGAAYRETRMNRNFLAMALVTAHHHQRPDGSKKLFDGGILFMYCNFVILWCMHGVEKLLEWEHWWVRGDALLLSLYSDEAYTSTRAFADWMLRWLPWSVHMLLCRSLVLLEFPLGLVMIMQPRWPRLRLCGFGLIFTALASFAVLLNVRYFPSTCIWMGLPFVPSIAWDAWEGMGRRFLLLCCGNAQRRCPALGNVYMDAFDCMGRVGRNESSFSPALLWKRAAPRWCRSLYLLWCKDESDGKTKNAAAAAYRGGAVAGGAVSIVKNITGGAAAMLVALLAVQSCLDRHEHEWGPTRMISVEWDGRIRELGDLLQFYGGWSAFTPPPDGRNWLVVVGVPAGTHLGVAVSYYGGINETNWRECDPAHAVHFSGPPFKSLADIPYWSSQIRRSFTEHVLYTPNVDLLKTRLLGRICKEFHERHPLPGQRLAEVALWQMQQRYGIRLIEEEGGRVAAALVFGKVERASPQELLRGRCDTHTIDGRQEEIAVLLPFSPQKNK